MSGEFERRAVAPLLALAQREPWWETVDGLAGIVGDVVRAGRRSDPDAQVTMDAALRHDCLWVRRTAMIHQLGWRLETDTIRLFGYAETLAPEGDFSSARPSAGPCAITRAGNRKPCAILSPRWAGAYRRSAPARRRGGFLDGCGRLSKKADFQSTAAPGKKTGAKAPVVRD